MNILWNGISHLQVNPTTSEQGRDFCYRLYKDCRIIKTPALDTFGYRLTARYIFATSTYKLFELLPVDGARPADACFLTVDLKFGGAIVPDSFQQHKKWMKAWRDKEKIILNSK